VSTDLPGLEKLGRAISAFEGLTVTVGFQGESGRAAHPDSPGTSIAQIAAAMEFGTQNVPARPFLRTTVQQKRAEISTAVAQTILSVVRGKTPVSAAAESGASVVAMVREIIDTARQWAEPLADNTVNKKRSSDPLVDSGALRDTVSYTVRRDNAPVAHGGDR